VIALANYAFIADKDFSYPLLTDDNKRVYDQYGMIEHTEDARCQAKRGIVLIDPDPTVRYRWEAEDNWDDWPYQALRDIHALTDELTR